MRYFVAILLVLTTGLGVFVAWEAMVFLNTPPANERREIVYEVRPAMALGRVAQELESRGAITSALRFRLAARLMGAQGKIKVGEYLLTSRMKPLEVLQVLASGRSIERQLTFPEGINIFEISEMIEAAGLLSKDQFIQLVRRPRFIRELLGEDRPSLEGYLFPETYRYTKFTTAETMVRAMVQRFLRVYGEIESEFSTPMPRHEHVTLASVIEKETGAPQERGLISSVFHNRLKRGMRLQSDPTILYGMLVETGIMPQNIRKADILRPSPYNTYTVPRLPSGPIANPGREALIAAARPQSSNFLYFVSRNDGTHVFTEDFADHNRAVKRFQLDRKAREGKSWRDLHKKKIN